MSRNPSPGAAPVEHLVVPREELHGVCVDHHATGARLAALWGSDERDSGEGFALHVLLATASELIWLETPLTESDATYPDLSDVFAAANRLQRAMFDLMGLRAITVAGPADTRMWLRHDSWPVDRFPLRRDFDQAQRPAPTGQQYPFVAVEGEGVHEIPVGPVHAGIIEPGHFRFSIVGEKVLRLEQHLGYTHKGVDKRFEAFDLMGGARLAGRVSGDSTVAFAWAYAMAVEAITSTPVPTRALLLRALALERERIANHLGDLGYLGNDGGLAFGLAQFMRLKEDVLRLNANAFGHRMLMDYVVPGGVARDLRADALGQLLAQADELEREVRTLWAIYEDHAGLQDRFQSCGIVTPELALRLGITGMAARASGKAIDLRVRPGFEPYDRLEPRIVTHSGGDVAARALVRREEISESLRLIRLMIDKLPAGTHLTALAAPPAQGRGIGWVEGWRGEVIVAIDADGAQIRRGHAHDPSWQNWPALEHAVIGNIVPDFPLINKSFNLSYSGADG